MRLGGSLALPRRPSVRALIATLALLWVPTGLPSQQPKTAETPPPLERVGEEAYRAICEFYEYDRTIPLEARVVEQKNVDGIVREKIVMRSTQGFLTPGYLQIPKTGSTPHPCVLLLHGWSGSKEAWFRESDYMSGGAVRKGLLAAGYAVFALDAQCHGDRIVQNDFAPVNHYADPASPARLSSPQARKGYFTQREIYTQTVVDYRRAIDYLETRRDIDAKRIGLLGYSMGGTQAFPLTAVDERIKASVACAVPADRKKFSLVAPQNYARGIGKRPFLMVMGNNDPMCSVAQAKELYSLIESPSTGLLFFGGHHKLTVDYVPDAVKWITERL
ncbi:MAG: alpha/beta fold hydrolase [Planctomycetaceae bacterium]